MLHSVRYKCTTGAQVLNCKICSSVTCLIVVTVTLFNLCPIFFLIFVQLWTPPFQHPKWILVLTENDQQFQILQKILKKNRFSADYTLTLTFLVHSMLQVRFKFLAIKIPWLRIGVRRTYSYWSINCGLEGRVKKCVRRTLTSIHPIRCFSDVAYLTYARMNHSEWLLVWIISKRKKLWNLYRQFDEG